MARTLNAARAMDLSRGWALSIVAALALAGCGGEDATPITAASSSAGAGGGGGAGGGAGGACPEGSHDDGGACIAALGPWTETTSLAKGRDHHVTFVATTPAGDFLLAGGGTNGVGLLGDVERAPIQADGTLGAFTAAGKLPRGVAGAGLAQQDRVVVLAGGLALEGGGAVSVTDTSVGTVADDGSIAFVTGPPLAVSRYHVTLTLDRGFVFAIGGLRQYVEGTTTKQAVEATVERAPFDGATLGDFTTLAPLPSVLTHHATFVREHAIYLVGGIGAGSAAGTDILRATVSETGDLSSWEVVGQLPEGRATSAAFVRLDRLYVVAGATKAMGGEVATVLTAPFDEAGHVGSFEEISALPLARAHAHQAPELGAFVFSAGGSINHKVQKQAFFARFE